MKNKKKYIWDIRKKNDFSGFQFLDRGQIIINHGLKIQNLKLFY